MARVNGLCQMFIQEYSAEPLVASVTYVRVPQRSCVRDEGRPLAIGLQEQVANHRKRLWLKPWS